MMAFEIPHGTTVRSLVEAVVPQVHALLVPEDAPADAFSVAVRVQGVGGWTVHIAGRHMRVVEGEVERPTLWLFTTERAVQRFLDDAAGPQRFVPRFEPAGGAAVLSDPRVVRRVAMASGRIELAMVDDDGERLRIVFGFGAATRREIDPEDADVTVETGIATIDRIVSGALAPQDALVDGDVRLRGSRMLAAQLALAVAPFYPRPAKSTGGR